MEKYMVGNKHELLVAMMFWRNTINYRLFHEQNASLIEFYKSKIERADELIEKINRSKRTVYTNYEDMRDLQNAHRKYMRLENANE